MSRDSADRAASEVVLEQPCEVVVQSLLPLIRKTLAIELVRKHGMSQQQTSRVLGVTQPAVSGYVRDTSGRSAVTSRFEGLQRALEEFADDLVSSRMTQAEAITRICSLCMGTRVRGPTCVLHAAHVPSLQWDRCSICLSDLSEIKRRPLEEYKLLEDTRTAVQIVESTSELGLLIPEIGMNIAYAKPDAARTEDVVGIPGRIRPIGGRPRASSAPDFGGSSHVSRAVLSIMKADPLRRAAINLRYDPRVITVCRTLDLEVSYFDRSDEPPEIKEVDGRTIPWGMQQALKQAGGVPDVVYDLGDIGKEPMVFIFGSSAVDVANTAMRIAKEYVRKYR